MSGNSRRMRCPIKPILLLNIRSRFNFFLIRSLSTADCFLFCIAFFGFLGSGELNVTLKRLTLVCSVYFSEWGSIFMFVPEFNSRYALRCPQS